MIARFSLLLILLTLLSPDSGKAINNYSIKLDSLNLPDSIYAQTSNCSSKLDVCLGSGVDPFNLSIKLDGQVYFGQIDYCQIDTIYRYTLSTLYGFGKIGPYNLTSWVINNKSYSGQFQDVNELVSLMNQFDPGGNWTFDENTLLIGGGVSGTDYSEMEVEVLSLGGAQGFIGLNTGLLLDGAKISIETGAHTIEVSENLTNTSDTIYVNYACVKPDKIKLENNLGETNKYCLDLSELTGSVNTIKNLCENSNGISSFFSLVSNNCVEYTGLSVGVDSFCAVVCDVNNICDTTTIIVETVEQNNQSTKTITLYEGKDSTYCLDLSNLPPNPKTIMNLCPISGIAHVEIGWSTTSFCIFMHAFLEGTDTACLKICNNLGECDTIKFIVIVKPLPKKDTVTVNVLYGKTVNYCIDKKELDNNITSLLNYCPGSSGTNASVLVNQINGCMQITGLIPGQDTGCFVSCNSSLGICDTTILIYNVLYSNPPKIVDITVEYNEINTYCIDTASLPGNLVAIINDCPSNSGTYANVAVDPQTYCVYALGISPGVDSACIIVCTDLGICDTVYIRYHVVSVKPPQVVNISLKEGEVINYCIDKGSLCSPINSVENICPNAVFDNASIDFSNNTLCAQISGITAGGSDTLCLKFCCDLLNCDTLYLIIHVEQKPGNQIININVEEGENTQYCLDPNDLCSPISSIVNLCPGNIYDNAKIDFNDSSLCADIKAVLAGGADTLCLLVNCGNTSDTIKLIVHVLAPQGSNQVLNITLEKGDSIQYCFSQAGICTPVNLLENLCPNAVYDNTVVSFDELTLCASIKAIKIGGADSLCFAFCCGINNCDTVTLIVHVVPKSNPPKIEHFTIDVTDTLKYCIDISNLNGPVTSITNLCGGLSGTYTNTVLDTTTLCFTFVGAVPGGQDVFCMVICDSTGLCDTTVIFINVIQKVITPDIVNLTVYEDSTIVYCLDQTMIGAPIISTKNLCPQSINDNVTFTYDNVTHCFYFKGFKAFGTDTACIVICGSNGFCDTTTIIIHCVKPIKPDTLYFNVKEGGSQKYCFDPAIVGGDIVSVINICPQISGDNAAYFYMNTDTCVTIVGIQSGGPDTACFLICNSTGFCDTVYMITNVFKDLVKEYNKTILLNFKDSVCFDVTGFDLNSLVITNDCPGSSGQNVNFTIQNNTICVLFTGISIGIDTACIHITDKFGNTLNAKVIVKVIPPSPNFVIDQIKVDSVKTFCLDLSQLAGNIVSIVNLCPQLSSGNVSFTINPQTACITVTGLTPGTDTLCMQYCDNLGACDTTYFYINVPVNIILPVANNDSITSGIGQAANIVVLTNDINPNGAGTVSILPISLGGVGPKHGTVVVNPDGSITYTPDAGFCGVDSFSYILCIPQGCDDAVVSVNITCPDEPIIYNAISPNFDDKNEFFTIVGLDKYPKNKLSIYNRWGNRVYNASPYNNEWRGTFEGNILPDGTYFYIFEPGNGKIYKGYLTIYR